MKKAVIKVVSFFKYLLSCFLPLLKGFLVGLFSSLPFINSHDVSHLVALKEEEENEKSIFKNFLTHLKNTWPILLGGLLGIIFFFLIPVEYLYTSYGFAISSSLACLSLIFLISEIYSLYCSVKKDKNIKSYLFSLVSALLTLIVLLIFYFIPSYSAIKVFFISFIASFSLFFSGISFGSLFLVSSSYIALSTRMNDACYLIIDSNNMSTIITLLLGLIFGFIASYILTNKFKNLTKEKNSSNIVYFLFGFIINMIDTINTPLYTDINTSELAQLFVILTMILASIGIGIGLTFHKYKKVTITVEENKNEIKKEEKKENVSFESSSGIDISKLKEIKNIDDEA